MEKWMVRNVKFNDYKLAKELKVSPILAKLLGNRDIFTKEDGENFLRGDIENLHNGNLLKDMDKAIAMIESSIIKGEKILIVGDYDVDGVISTFILTTALSRCGAEVNYHIPDRIKEGYGINESIIRNASENQVDLIVTCDNGIAAIEQVKLAKELGIKVIITDHHDIPFKEAEGGEKKYILPEADCIINPKRLDCKYPFKSICGAGVAYKLVSCLYEKYNIPNREVVELLQYVAIATVCDVVDLIDENRIIVKKGLELLNNTENIGLKELYKISGLSDKEITVYSLGFVIGPSINASGRLEQAIWALKLLRSKNVDEAKMLAEKLHELNKERQELTKEGLDEAVRIIEENEMQRDKVLVVYLPEVHESIAGIIAGRIREKYNLPTIVLTKGHDGAKGSGRSIEEYNMFEELSKCKEILNKFGGHPMAAGLSLDIDNIENFRNKLNELTTLTDEDVVRKISIDLPLSLNNLNFNLINEISLLEPYGKANPKPVFGVKGLTIKKAMILGKDKNVLKLSLTDGRYNVEGIRFNGAEEFQEKVKKVYGEEEYNSLLMGKSNRVRVDIVYTPEINTFGSIKNLQLIIQSYRFSL